MTLRPSQLKAARQLLGWSKIKLALQSGVGSFVIDKFERGERTLHPGSLDALRGALQAAGVEMIEGDPPSVRLRKSK
jgi:transcriptional regulator with XRE-family HTH domain